MKDIDFKDIDIELLYETFHRIVKLFKDNSNLNIFLDESKGDIYLRNFSEIFIVYKNDPYSKLVFKADTYGFTIDNIYSFLLSDNNCERLSYYPFNNCSIFRFAECCRNYYEKYSSANNNTLNDKVLCEYVL